MAPPELTDYEKGVAKQVARNQARLLQLVPVAAEIAAEQQVPASRPPRRFRAPASPGAPAEPARRSARAEGRPAVHYGLDGDVPEGGRPRRASTGPRTSHRVEYTEELLATLTAAQREYIQARAVRRGARAALC